MTRISERIKVNGEWFEEHIPEDAIGNRTNFLAHQVMWDYRNAPGDKPLHIIDLALGGTYWAVDLARAIRRRGVKTTRDTIQLSSYGSDTASSGVVTAHNKLSQATSDRHILVVDEVVDTGATLTWFLDKLRSGELDPEHKSDGPKITPASVSVAVLADKFEVHNGTVPINYAGFRVAGAFLIGMGMDWNQQGRDLPAIYRMVPENEEPGNNYYEIPDTTPPKFQS